MNRFLCYSPPLRRVNIVLLIVVTLLPVMFHADAGEPCPGIDKTNIRAVWEAVNSDDLRYFLLDLSSPGNGLLACGVWYDSAMVSLFKLTNKNIRRGSIVLLFESASRNRSDKIVISGTGKACDSSGYLEAELQMVLEHRAVSKKIRLVFRKMAPGRSHTLKLLEYVADVCRKKAALHREP